MMIPSRALPHTATWKYSPLTYGMIIVAGLLDMAMAIMVLRTIYMPHTGNISGWLYAMEISIVAVQIGIWIIAFRGAHDFMRYINTIKGSADGKGMTNIAKALLCLIAYIIIVPLTSTFAELMSHTRYHTALLVIQNHVPIVVMLFVVGYLYTGSKQLVRITHMPLHRGWLTLAVGLYAVVAVAFTWHFITVVPEMIKGPEVARFALPFHALLFTYVLPHIVAWFVGVLAVFNLWHYSIHVEGNIYRTLFSRLYLGILLVFTCTFIAQLLTASTVTLSTFTIGVAVIYAVLLLAVVGYMLIYRGINRLMTLEALV